MEYWDFIITFLAGAGAALAPTTIEKGWNLFIRIKYRRVIETYSILTARTMSVFADLEQATYKKTIEISMELSRLRNWKALKSILSDTIYALSSTKLELLYFHLGMETTNKWIKEWDEKEKEKREFVNEIKRKKESGHA